MSKNSYIQKFSGEIKDGRAHVSMSNRDRFDSYIQNEFKEGDRIWISVGRLSDKKIRSVEANNYYWGVVVHMLSLETGYEKDEMHEALKLKFLQWEPLEGIPTTVSTSKLSSDQFAEYVERIKRWAAIDLGVYIPSPNDLDLSAGSESAPF
jgi:hypothetical protein